MEESVSSVRVSVYGDEYPIKGAADPKYIHRVASYVDTKMKEIADKASPRDKLKVAILAAFNIAGELLELKREPGSDSAKLIDEVINKTEELNSKIDRALAK